MPEKTDEEADLEAIESVLDGDVDAFEKLVARYQKPLISMIGNLIDDHDESRDVAQEVFLAAFRNLASFDPARSLFSTWLFAIARNRSLNVLRSRKRRNISGSALSDDLEKSPDVPGTTTQSPRDETGRREDFARLDAALRALPGRLRRVFVCAEFEGLRYEEIAQLEGIRPGTVKSRISRARERIRAALRRGDKE